MSVRSSVCLSRYGIVSKRFNISSTFFLSSPRIQDSAMFLAKSVQQQERVISVEY